MIDKYRGHKNKLFIWGDRNGNNKQANSELTYYEQIIKRFMGAGFVVKLMVKDRLDPFHALKHHVINLLLTEKDAAPPHIKINQMKCKPLIICIQNIPGNT